MTNSTLRVGILGAGFISNYHLKAIARHERAVLVAVCDLNEQAARKLASGAPEATVYASLDTMLAEAHLNVVHLLTQPDSHFALAKRIIEAGCHAIVEKPITISADQAEELEKLAARKGVSIAVNHNFVFSRPFNRLKAVIERGELGPLKSIRVVWKKALPQVSSGPWNLWMLREPGNILFETGSHSLSELLSITNKRPVIGWVAVNAPKVLPSGSTFYRRWHIFARSGDISIQIESSFDLGYEQHFVEVEGMFGVARADMENDVFALESPTGRANDIERLSMNCREGWRRIRQAIHTFCSYSGSKFLVSPTGGPYETSMLNGIFNCYEELDKRARRSESSIVYAIEIAKTAEAIQAQMPKGDSVAGSRPGLPVIVSEPTINAKSLIVGASGFIGKRLLMALQNDVRGVRALVRNASSLAGMRFSKHCEIMVGDYRDESVAEKALTGIETVFHLAVAHGNSLAGYQRVDSEPTVRFAHLCNSRNIKRFIYTGTIDSLNLAHRGKLKEADGIDGEVNRRNNYARSKALTERVLMDMHAREGLPLVIVRPAIVLGVGGPVSHLGVAEWFGLGRCTYWGKGDNLIPVVLIEDVVSALVSSIDAKGIEGRAYNLSAEPCLSARDYVAEVEKILGCRIIGHSSNAYRSWATDMVKWILKVAARHPDRSRIPSVHDWRCREQHASFDTSAAQQDLNWRPNNDREEILEKGVREPARLLLNG